MDASNPTNQCCSSQPFLVPKHGFLKVSNTKILSNCLHQTWNISFQRADFPNSGIITTRTRKSCLRVDALEKGCGLRDEGPSYPQLVSSLVGTFSHTHFNFFLKPTINSHYNLTCTIASPTFCNDGKGWKVLTHAQTSLFTILNSW